jgi:hypothetical protein
VERYFRNLAIFASASVLLTMLILNLRVVVGVLGLAAVADSIELAGSYGQATAAIVVLGTIALLRFLADRGYTAPWAARWRSAGGRLRAWRARGAGERAMRERMASAEEYARYETTGQYGQ